MRFWIAFLSFLVGITGAVAGEQSSLLDEALSVDRVVIQEINDEGGLADSAISTESMFVPYGPSLPVPKYRLDSPELVLDLIINLGKKIWTLVEANKPVVNVATDSASALQELRAGKVCRTGKGLAQRSIESLTSIA
jgi:hypothetical protein